MKYLCIIGLFLAACTSESAEDTIRYQPFSTSVIKVNFETTPSDTMYLEAWTINNIPDVGQRSEEYLVTSEGNYLISLTNDRPNSAILSLNGQKYNIIIFPNDTVNIGVHIMGEEVDMRFRGKGATINEYYQAKKNQLGYTDIRMPLNVLLSSSASYQLIQETTDSIVSVELNFLQDYLREKELPEWFVKHEKAEIKYAGLGFKSSIPTYNELFSVFQDRVPKDYFSFLDEATINDPTAMTSANYLLFLDDYFLRDLPTSEFKDLAGFDRLSKIQNHILPQSKVQLSGDMKELYHKHLFSSILSYLTDSVRIDSLANVYEVEDYELLRQVVGTRSREKLATLDLVEGDTIPNFYAVDRQDSLVSLRDYREKLLYVNFWATWCGPCIKNIPALNDMITSYGNQDNIVFLNVCLESDKDRWHTAIQRYDLLGTNVFAEGQWGKKLRAMFNISGIPTYVLIAKENVLYENHTNKAPAVRPIIGNLLEKSATQPLSLAKSPN
ncbi:MAG: TlpA disulfide reductase family protein [Bacteroidota bacterium]